MKCPNCDTKIKSSLTAKCPNCGFKFDEAYYQEQSRELDTDDNYHTSSIDPEDYPSSGLVFSSFLFPLIGLIAIFFRSKGKPYTRKIYIIATLVGTIAWAALLFLIFNPLG